MIDDMVIPNILHDRLFEKEKRRNGIVDRSHTWPNKTVVYYLDPEYSGSYKELIKLGIGMIESNTCIKFVELVDPTGYSGPYVNVVPKEGCYSRIGSKCLNNVCEMSLQIPVKIV